MRRLDSQIFQASAPPNVEDKETFVFQILEWNLLKVDFWKGFMDLRMEFLKRTKRDKEMWLGKDQRGYFEQISVQKNPSIQSSF